MSVESRIEWTDSTWNPVRGCSRVSPGCTNCYAERVAARFSAPGVFAHDDHPMNREAGPFHEFAKMTPQGPRWTGKVALVEKHLLDPLRWREPRRIFVNSMSDLFHESLPDEAIDRVFAVMALAPRHTFQILTKRAERMRAYLTTRARHNSIELAAEKVRRGPLEGKHVLPRLPLPNVWLGVSVEDRWQYSRIDALLSTPAAVRFLSCEPLLGEIDLTAVPVGRCGDECKEPCQEDVLRGLIRCGCSDSEFPDHDRRGHLDWIIIGGESGPGARPCDLAWVRSIVEQCKAAGVACFVKQLGAAAIDEENGVVGAAVALDPEAEHLYKPLRDRKGGHPDEWPEDLRIREFPR